MLASLDKLLPERDASHGSTDRSTSVLDDLRGIDQGATRIATEPL